jgi:hypothetical protein
MSERDKDSRGAAKDFFAAYFHEDWAADSSNVDEVVATFLAESPRADELIRIAEGIDLLLQEGVTDEAAEHILVNELGCYYLPSADGRSARRWLGSIASSLRARALEA